MTIERPLPGTSISTQTPSFAGTTDDTIDPVTLSIYAGASATGTPVETPPVLLVSETWEASAQPSLPDGEYTALVEQTNGVPETASATVTFTVDTTAPVVSVDPVSSPTRESTPTLTG
ncbi:MAG: Ig-like domain-containing protein, partial [Solirubrobacteraceae bacterium]